ncbi:MAG: GPR endopeptidase [Oscillospiraceae bacterium]|nr:GPR endopeptidase [Oscillospiraceae bacterium]
MSIRTDLAVEAHELSRGQADAIDGVKLQKTVHGSISRTVVDITSDNGAETLGKEKGRYITIEAPDLKYSLDDYENVCRMLASEIKSMCPQIDKTLVVGLGNQDITPDALGSEAISQLIITSHIKEHMPGTLDDDYSSVCAVAPGVMGTTGIETVEIIKGITEKVKPDTIIAIDALAGADIKRVCTTIQIADTGIAPGSGVGNNREGLNEQTLGVKVIAIGVPTVIAAELLSDGNLPEEYATLMVTTKDIDLVIKRMSRTVANGINMALHKNLSFRDIESIVD